jgi:hypothetical protein
MEHKEYRLVCNNRRYIIKLDPTKVLETTSVTTDSSSKMSLSYFGLNGSVTSSFSTNDEESKKSVTAFLWRELARMHHRELGERQPEPPRVVGIRTLTNTRPRPNPNGGRAYAQAILDNGGLEGMAKLAHQAFELRIKQLEQELAEKDERLNNAMAAIDSRDVTIRAQRAENMRLQHEYRAQAFNEVKKEFEEREKKLHASVDTCHQKVRMFDEACKRAILGSRGLVIIDTSEQADEETKIGNAGTVAEVQDRLLQACNRRMGEF